ncbi:hypothetical protein CEUSTIGMA_g11780.t1 [Chlamydomonas eustigma]|uniref:J domain-containing protein n=1 Tax=Chlamydomonas eustigma TaxID=1157962 RepID=A0A250XMQ6_9CHLO|nr:hypothetical protein CEUSTIGMA_g11780.t1 [Chlamydomonas eustigma]|eukprot:GAX84358.1 hypothetical protein CEUSTIGMA_g11780.t1 [Chlamydomonas eustigma]
MIEFRETKEMNLSNQKELHGKWRSLPLELPQETKQALLLLGLTDTHELSYPHIKKAFQEHAKMHHPDKPGGSPDHFMEIRAAYKHLMETHKTGLSHNSVGSDGPGLVRGC